MRSGGFLQVSILVLIGATLVLPPAGTAQETKSKNAARPPRQMQRLSTGARTQGGGREAGDQILLYRFRLDRDTASSELIVSNPTEREGAFSLFAQEVDGTFSKEAKHTIGPGGLFAVSAAEAAWSPSNVVFVKASRRLLLSVQFRGADKPTEILRSPSVAVYDIFGFERQSELGSSAKQRGLSLLFSDGSFSQQLPREATPQQGVSELVQTSGRAPTQGLFVLHGN